MKVVTIGQCRCLFQFSLRGVRFAQQDIFPNAGIEEIGILGNQRNLLPQVVQLVLPDVVAIELHRSAGGVPEPHGKVGAGGLASTGAAHQRDGVARFHVKTDSTKGLGLSSAVLECHAVECH